MIYKINSIALSRLTNAAHVAFMSNVKAYIDLQEPSVLGIDTNLYDSFIKALSEEQDIVNRSRASAYTVLMKDSDELRDNYFRRIYHKLRAALYDVENPVVQPDTVAMLEADFISQYPLSICNARAQDKTAKIRGFLYDIDKQLEGLIEDFDLAKDIAALKKANDEFEKTYLYRVLERTRTVETSEKRNATEELYHQICIVISYLANSNATAGDAKAKMAVCQHAIGAFNQLVKEFRLKINSNGDSINGDADDIDPDDDEGLTPDPSLESEGSEMLNDSSEPISEQLTTNY